MNQDIKIVGKIILDETPTQSLIEQLVKDTTRVKDGRMFRFSIPYQISSTLALEIQAEMGYIAAGYGFYGFENGIEETTWSCGDCCD